MHEQQSLWRTAWYWKQICLYLVLPLIVLLGALTVLTRTHHLAQHQSEIIARVVSSLSPVVFAIWINFKAKKRAAAQQA